MKVIHVSVRDFALPVPRIGSIELHSGFGRAISDGQEIHLNLQEKRKKDHSNYQSEIAISHNFEREGFRFQINGRMDGLFNEKIPKIEEIKTSSTIQELVKKLSDPHSAHPYSLQLKTYGYFYWLQNQVIPKLIFFLVSTRTGESETLEIKFDINKYKEWLDLRLDELVKEVRLSKSRVQRRKKISKNFTFPFENSRPGQKELIQFVEQSMKTRSHILVQAPTGLGKTVGILYPALKEAFHRGQNVIYVTPKNSQHQVAENAIAKFNESGAKIKSLTITAKSKICFKNEPLCDPGYCEFAKDHYTKVYTNKILQSLAKKRTLKKSVFQRYGEEYQVCPYQLQMDLIQDVDTVICDYNYVLGPKSSLESAPTSASVSTGKPNLVLDEAHNIPFRAMDYYSSTISSIYLDKLKQDLQANKSLFKLEAERLVEECIQILIDSRPTESTKSQKIELSLEPFLEQDLKLKTFLSRYVDSGTDIQARDPILRLCFYWSDFTSCLELGSSPEHKEFFTTYHYDSSGGTIKITCGDASKLISARYQKYEQVVGFSATLKPFDYYSKLSGLTLEVKTAEFQSPFLKTNRKLLLIPQISTKYSDRERNYSKIAEAIHRICSLRHGNYFVFFPSFTFLTRVSETFQVPSNFTLIKQERDMNHHAVQSILDHLKSKVCPTIVFGVQGGVFSEGVDYPGDMIIGAFIVGPPLPNFDLEREEMRNYYDKQYNAGFNYAYTFPAMAKAVQAAGRVIRTETDRGLIVLMDYRFLHPNYTQSMPKDWYETSVKELVSKGILKEVSDFWLKSK